MAMKKFGSDPEGSRVNNLEAGEAENKVKSATFRDGMPSDINEKLPSMDLSGEKDWTPLYDGTDNHNRYAKGKSDQSE